MGFWNNLSIKVKFVIGMLFILIVTIISTLLFSLTLQDFGSKTASLKREGDFNLVLLEREIQHLQWASSLANYLLSDKAKDLTVTKDPTQCAFGKWYYSDEKDAVIAMFPDIKDELSAIEEPHKALHASAEKIENFKKNAQMKEALQVYEDETLPSLQKVRDSISSMGKQLKASISAQEEDFAQEISFAQKRAIILGVFASLVVCVLTYVLFVSILKPIALLTQYSKDCKDGVSSHLTLSGDNEFSILANNLSSLMLHLHERLSFAQGILNGMTIPCSVFSPEDKTVFTNQLMIDLLERTGQPEDYLNQTSGEYIWGDKNRETISTRALKEKKLLSADLEFKTHKGQSRHARVTSAPFYDGRNNLLGTLSIWIDDTVVINNQKIIEENSQRIAEAALSVQDIAHNVSISSSEISTQVANASHGAELQSNKTAETATAMMQMNSTVLNVARSASDASDTAANAHSKAIEGSEAVAEVMKSIADASRYTVNVKEGMDNLGTQADGIGAIINVINDIADQTNLLALNAAIEAARAGDAGRGFAVVADEVRKLAEKTMHATGQVSSVISGIQKGTTENMEHVEHASTAVQEANALAIQAGESLETIVSLVEDVAKQIEGIAGASAEQSSASNQINSALEEISHISDEASKSMTEVSMSIENLAKQANILRGLIDRLK